MKAGITIRVGGHKVDLTDASRDELIVWLASLDTKAKNRVIRRLIYLVRGADLGAWSPRS